nr:G protein-coupled receptor [Proales similis]
MFILNVILLVLVLQLQASTLEPVRAESVKCVSRGDVSKVSEREQENSLKREMLLCQQKSHLFSNNSNQSLSSGNLCAVVWDTVMCWNEASVNTTLYAACPSYVNNLVFRNQASKTCYFEPALGHAIWSKTDFSQCLPSLCSPNCRLEDHIRYVIILRIIGYSASFTTLAISIAAFLTRRKLRCPRNLVHINLFVAFKVHMLSVIAFNHIIEMKIEESDPSALLNTVDDRFLLCKFMASIFRYTGSVYHAAIFSEAFYMVLLLRYPFYDEMKGWKFCIGLTWLLPLAWVLPWIVSRAYLDNYWCWQTESIYNLIIKIPHTFLLCFNIIGSVMMLRILYSKMDNRNVNPVKLIKYRRIAKSTLIIIPIFGLHFIIFDWLSYINLMEQGISDCVQIMFAYFETFCNAFQGVFVSFACCFIHQEARNELVCILDDLFNKVVCCRSLRERLASRKQAESRQSIKSNRASSAFANLTQRPAADIIDSEGDDLSTRYRASRFKNSIWSKKSIYEVSDRLFICACLFGEKKNDFFTDSRQDRARDRKRLVSRVDMNESNPLNEDEQNDDGQVPLDSNANQSV